MACACDGDIPVKKKEKNSFCQYCSIGGTGMLTMENSTANQSEYYSNIPVPTSEQVVLYE